jgi:tetratricopeptide (TPR) repeat protein
MKRSLAITLLVLAAAGCAAISNHDENPYDNPFYARYLNTGSALDAQIARAVEGLQENPNSPTLHNELGGLLMQKGFPNDARVEFQRAIAADKTLYAAWYNLALVNASMGEHEAAHKALERTVDLKPGHAAALFQLGLIEEKNGNIDDAVKYYAKAYRHNPRLLEVAINPRILDSKLTHLAMLELYPAQAAKHSMQFQPTPNGYRDPEVVPAPAPQPKPSDNIVPATTTGTPATQTTT